MGGCRTETDRNDGASGANSFLFSVAPSGFWSQSPDAKTQSFTAESVREVRFVKIPNSHTVAPSISRMGQIQKPNKSPKKFSFHLHLVKRHAKFEQLYNPRHRLGSAVGKQLLSAQVPRVVLCCVSTRKLHPPALRSFPVQTFSMGKGHTVVPAEFQSVSADSFELSGSFPVVKTENV